MIFEILPDNFFGPIQIGMSKQRVNSILGEDFYHIELAHAPGFFEDRYFNRRVNIKYNKYLYVCSIDVVSPMIAMLFGKNLLKMKKPDMEILLSENGYCLIEEDDRFICNSLNLSLTKNCKNKTKISSVCLRCEDYDYLMEQSYHELKKILADQILEIKNRGIK